MIFYFSGTGNTRWAATQIAEAVGDELLFIPELISKNSYEFSLQPGERIGFCFPTHGWQVPGIVRGFIRKLRINGLEPDTFCWSLTTCGDNVGETMTILNKELAANDHLKTNGKPLQATAVFSVVMPETYVCLPFMYTDTEEREREKISAAKARMPHIAECIREKRTGVEELVKGSTPRLYSYVIGSYFNKRMIHDRKFTVDREKCIGCGKCAKVCPVENIKGTPPEWIHNERCTCCMACYHYCPTHAINYGKTTRKRGQYFFNRRGDQR